MSLLDIVTCWWRRPVLEPAAPAESDALTANLLALTLDRDNLAHQVVQLSRQIDERDDQIRRLRKQLDQADQRASFAESLTAEPGALAHEQRRAPHYPTGAHTEVARLRTALRTREEQLARAEQRPAQAELPR